jgi:hypothetical protein
MIRGVLVALVALALIAAPTTSFAEGRAKETGKEGGLGAAAAVSSLVYGPVKLLYATGGLVIGAFAWAFTAGDSGVAETVFTRSLRGTYVITPGILTGDEELVFIGRDVEQASTQTEAVASASPQTTSEPFDDSGYDEMGW